MRYGFFHGTEGDATALAAALELLADCDRIVCLGGLVGAPGPGDAAALAQLESVVCLAGPEERKRARDASLPAEVRARLHALPPASVVDGIAALGHTAPAPASRREAQAVGGAPRLVAPLAVTAGSGATQLWRATGGLCRVEELGPGARVGLAGERIRLDLAPARRADGVVRVAVIDRQGGTVELREKALGARPAARPAKRAPVRRRRVFEAQQLLAV
jgi:hypothetical protein